MEVLELVGLEKRYGSKVKTFSHGMKQRLGLAQVLLHDPDLIILDEPTTGLDPQGMKEIRELIIHLSRDKKKTLFLSSHILYEVELVANRMTIINKGKAIVEGEVDALLNMNKLKVTFEVNDSEQARQILGGTDYIKDLETVANNIMIFSMSSDKVAGLNKYLIENKIEVSAVIPTRSLEEYFLNITEKAS
ncbi:MAG TPA: ABC transporter ATP-binding protein, partial [Ignavibacteriaceae bacterium]|nr:ABC transporter ATP-binding protein [Ignavibacteriaceae bacterium]